MHDLLRGTQRLQDFAYAYPERNRVFGGPAHMDTVNYLYHELKNTGYYHVYKQPQVHTWTKTDQNLTINGEDVEALSMTYSPSVDITAALVLVSNLGCDESDFPADVTGKIAVIQRGDCPFGEKSARAGTAGAAGVILYNNAEGSLSGTLGSPTSELGSYAPVVGVSLADGQSLVQQMEEATVKAHLYINSQMKNRTTYNVIAQTKGGDQNNVVSLGGHTDSVEAGPGINDDGSGIISNLVIAKALTRFRVKNAVRFFFWTAEEFGLLGSEFYVSSLSDDELAKIRLYLNFDMVASPNYALFVYDGDGSAFNQTGPVGSDEIEHMFEKYFASRGLASAPTAFDGRSDYAGFIERGIPAGGVFTGAEGIKTEEEARLFGGKAGVAYDPNYHAVGDTMDNLNHKAFLINSQAIAHSVATYARSLSSIPARAENAKNIPRQLTRKHSGSHGAGCFHSVVSE